MDRRKFLKAGIIAGGGGAVLPVAFVNPVSAQSTMSGAAPGESPYGPLSDTPDENGLLLPAGFTSRIVAIGGDPVGDSGYEWHAFPDGAGTFDDGEGGWYYVCNSEVFDFMAPDAGGVSCIHFAADGSIIDAYRILSGSNSNCAGGVTPWGTWLSGEENFGNTGRLWECDPTGKKEAVFHEAMGRWIREAAAVDPEGQAVYMTEDHREGRIYRYTPTNYPDLSAGLLEVCIVAADNSVSWAPIPDPSGTTEPTRRQVPESTIFPGNEGIWYHDGWIYFTSKLDHAVHGIDLRNQKYLKIWSSDPDADGIENAVLSHVDNITVDGGTGDLYVAEDGGNMEVVIITPQGAIAPFVRVVGDAHEPSEITGPVFNPKRDRLYFSSQRGPSNRDLADIIPNFSPIEGLGAIGKAAGVTFEISGPFRGRIEDVVAPPETEAPTTTASPVTTLAAAAESQTTPAPSGDDGGGSGAAIGIGIGVVAAAAVVGGAVAFRKKRMDSGSTDTES